MKSILTRVVFVTLCVAMLGHYVSTAQARMNKDGSINNENQMGHSDSDYRLDDVNDILDDIIDNAENVIDATECLTSLEYGESDVEQFLSCLKELIEPLPDSPLYKSAPGGTVEPLPRSCIIFPVWKCGTVFRDGSWQRVCKYVLYKICF